jgi:GPN-loop GTPase
MVHLMRVIDRVTGYVYLPESSPNADDTANAAADSAARLPNAYQLLSTAAGPIKGPRSDVREVQERWVDAREVWDQWEEGEWRREGEAARSQKG